MKIYMVAIQTAICLLEAASLFSMSTYNWGNFTYTILSLYLLGLEWKWMLSSHHRTLHPHIIMLVTTAAVMSLVANLSTNSRPVAIRESHGVKWTTASLYAILSGISFSVPQGPGFYYSHKYVYPINESSEDTPLTDAEENVCHSICKHQFRENQVCPCTKYCCFLAGSFWGNLVFSYTHSVLELGKFLRSIDIKDLPVLPASMRAPYNYARAQSLLAQSASSIVTSMLPSDTSGYKLGRRIISTNAASFTLQFILAVLTAVTFYGPAWFLQKFVKFLETPVENRDIYQGWVYVAGLTAASVISVLSKLYTIPTYLGSGFPALNYLFQFHSNFGKFQSMTWRSKSGSSLIACSMLKHLSARI